MKKCKGKTKRWLAGFLSAVMVIGSINLVGALEHGEAAPYDAPELTIMQGADTYDLKEGITYDSSLYELAVVDEGGFDVNVPGDYEVTYSLTSLDGTLNPDNPDGTLNPDNPDPDGANKDQGNTGSGSAGSDGSAGGGAGSGNTGSDGAGSGSAGSDGSAGGNTGSGSADGSNAGGSNAGDSADSSNAGDSADSGNAGDSTDSADNSNAGVSWKSKFQFQ